ncbi:fused DSP-PTPase phosphatase/NAD kinase-like protein [Nisaea sp.]|uniref:fused DSP-PTPase phosphatase/NAD kinase-like protein n=1 Tax=Nisaea sp. TaxID=2024842 RepID=UPI003B528A8B
MDPMTDSPTENVPARRPLEGAERLRAWWHLMTTDHGFVRSIYLNKHRVSDELWRSAQPSPLHLERLADEGFRTVLNLRGAEEDNYRYRLEREACARLGLKLVSLPIRSRNPLKPEILREAIEVWDKLDAPTLMHCKSGADRTGLMSTLYLHLVKGVPMREAMGQLSLKYGHLRHGRTGIVDHVFEQFAARHDETGISFRDWAEREYDPDTLQAGFQADWFASLITDKILRRE